jgi:methyl-accepting chemotaxis protein
MLNEYLFVGGVIVLGGVGLISVVLYLIFKKNLTMRLWLGLVPSIGVLVIITYIWGRSGGLYNLTLTFTLVPFGIAILIVNFLLVGKTIMGRINDSVDAINETANHVTAASSQISSSIQSLAEGSSEQAAAIEETSSSLEEMSSMTKQNANNANQADSLMKETSKIVADANTSMGALTTSMAEITKASHETSRIIKTIDEIAFQTNLLALNAAVEAARAGEAGAGFAVVAEEVRNLSMRAAEAAQNTSSLIEDTVKKIGDGSKLVTATSEDFAKVSESVRQVGGLVSEITSASNEQAQGIDQVNISVSEMDKVVQQNAANAEEIASIAKEMESQAADMKGVVNDMIMLIRGIGKEAEGETRYSVKRNEESAAHRIRSTDIIPLKDEGFSHF